MFECTSEAPEKVKIIIECEIDVLFNKTYEVESPFRQNSTMESVIVPLYEQCNISIVFSNEAGSSEPFILAFGKYLVFMCIILEVVTNRHNSSYNNITKYHITECHITNRLIIK